MSKVKLLGILYSFDTSKSFHRSRNDCKKRKQYLYNYNNHNNNN